MLRNQASQGFSHGCTGNIDGGLLPRILAQRRWNLNLRHVDKDAMPFIKDASMKWSDRRPRPPAQISQLSFVHVTSASHHFTGLIHEFLVALVDAGKFERIGNPSRAILHARDHVGTSKPMRFRKIRYRPTRGMIRMGVIEANNIFTAFASLALNADQLLRVDVISIVWRVCSRVSAASD